jgi:putative membrane-bound dehydrogenase-like protein
MRILLTLLAFVVLATPSPAAEPPPLKVLFLGDAGHHLPVARFRQLEPVFAARNIALTYTASLDVLTADGLKPYDGLMVFANIGRGTPEQVQAIREFVAAGKGFVPVHCASYCFTNNDDYVKLVGAQFRSHTTGVFRVKSVAEHPVTAGFTSFESWDETYVHHKHNPVGRTVLEVRTDGDLKEPWTWVRDEGKGRVFYTAWGHDQRTWSHPGFHNLLERGTRWACGQDPALAGPYADAPKMTPVTGPATDFVKVPAKVPFYPPSKTWGVTAAPITTMQSPLSPEKSLPHYSVPAGFKLELFAADADFQGGKPIATTWDERGRLWAAVTVDYPNELQKKGEGRDKIVILEDTDGDGRADKFTVFADKLSIPTSLLCVHGGVIVHQAPDTLFLKDTDGDGVADVRQVLFTGWATNDTHAGPSNLRYGFDNWVYGSVGYAGFSGTVNGEKLSFRQGYYRFQLRPAGKELAVSKLEFLRSTSNNTWGLAFDEQGRVFGSTANGCPLVHLAIPNRYYEKVRGLSGGVLPNIALDNAFHPITDKVRQVDWHNGFTSAANCSIYTARTYPPEYWNKAAFVSEPTGHLTATFQLQPTGTDFVARYGWNLAAADDEWAAPIDAQVGPDGMVWLLDWYNYIVQHNPTPTGFSTGKGAAYETPLRDKKHGRIYRVVYTAAKPEATPKLTADVKPGALIEALKHSNLFWRLHAQRMIVERNLDLGDELPKLLAHPVAGVHAKNLPGAKAFALSPTDKLSELLALSDTATSPVIGTRLAGELAKLDAFTDKNLADATVIAAAVHAESVLTALAATPAALTPAGLKAVELVAATYASKSPDTVGAVLTKLAGKGTVSDAVVAGVVAGWPAGKNPTLSATQQADFRTMLPTLSANSRGRLLKLGSAWGVEGLDAEVAGIVKALLVTVADAKQPEAARLAAARQAVELRPADDASVTTLLASVTPQSPPAYTAAILDALNGSQAKSLGLAVTAKLKELSPANRTAALRTVLGRPESAKAFLDAVEAGTLRFDMLALDQKTALAAHPNAAIATRAKKLLASGGGLPDADRQKVIDGLHPILAKVGDVGNGKKMFTAHCAKCHKHGAEGLVIGPDLTGFAVHPKEEILIAIMDPSRSVEGNYKSYTARLLDGRVIAGLLAAETKTTVELLDAENKRHPLQRDDLEDFTESAKSLMPEGFEKQMTAVEMTDLLEFLTLKGKYVPVPLDKVATVVTTRGMFFDADGDIERLVFKDWSPKEFHGVPFVLTDPQGQKAKNAVMLHSTNGTIPPTMPKSVTLPCNTAAKAIHLLSGVGGWCYPALPRGTTSLTVRLRYADGSTEDHALKNGVHFSDYIGRTDVSGSEYAFELPSGGRKQQMRYLAVTPKRADVIATIEFVKGPDDTAPVVMAVTIETP